MNIIEFFKPQQEFEKASEKIKAKTIVIRVIPSIYFRYSFKELKISSAK